MTQYPLHTSGGALAPTRLISLFRSMAGPIWRLVGVAAVIETTGRRSGKTRRVSVIPVDLDGRTYVLAFGGITNWSLNLRATAEGKLHRRRRTWAFTAIEVAGPERERVIARYLAGSGPAKKDFNRRPDPADHPAFRLDPVQ